MTTLNQMVDQVIAEIQNYVRVQDSITTITAGIDATVLSFTVDDPTAIAKGVVEIDEELILVKKINTTTGVADVIPGGRGWSATTAAAHSLNAIVRNNPTFPKNQVKRAINETITTMNLYSVKSYDFTFDGTTHTYVLPTDVVDVTGVSYATVDSSGRWPQLTHFRIDQNFWPEGATAPRTAIELYEAPIPGEIVRVQYLAQGVALANGAEFSTSGLPSTAEDVVRFGAMWRLISTVDPGKLLATNPSADALDAPVPVGRASEVSRYIYQLFQARLNEEKNRQADQLVTILHYQ